MYIRFTQPPADLFDWYEEYLQDEEEIDVKAGGGQVSNDRFRLFFFCYRFLLEFFQFCNRSLRARCSPLGNFLHISDDAYRSYATAMAH